MNEELFRGLRTSKIIFKREYDQALNTLKDVLKKKSGQMNKKSVSYYAASVSRSFPHVDSRELARMVKESNCKGTGDQVKEENVMPMPNYNAKIDSLLRTGLVDKTEISSAKRAIQRLGANQQLSPEEKALIQRVFMHLLTIVAKQDSTFLAVKKNLRDREPVYEDILELVDILGEEMQEESNSYEHAKSMGKEKAKKYDMQLRSVKNMKEENLEEGRPSQRHPLEGHPYHKKSDAELHYIVKDAGKTAEAMKGHNPDAENKYRDQVNDASTVLHFRKTSGNAEWYKKKYSTVKEENLFELSKGTIASYIKKASKDIGRTAANAADAASEYHFHADKTQQHSPASNRQPDKGEKDPESLKWHEQEMHRAKKTHDNQTQRTSKRHANIVKAVNKLYKEQFADEITEEVEKPNINHRALYTQSYAKHHMKGRDAARTASYDAVKKKFGADAVEKLKKWHDHNEKMD